MKIAKEHLTIVATHTHAGPGGTADTSKEPFSTFRGDTSLLVFLFERMDGKKLLLYNYACHPTVTGPGNMMITAVFPYAVERDLDYDLVMFVNSKAGDISTRFTRKTSGFEQVEIYSKYLLNGIFNALKQPVYQGDFTKIAMQRYPIKKVRPVEVEKAAFKAHEEKLAAAVSSGVDSLTLRMLSTYVEGAKIAIGLADEKSYDEMVYEAMSSPFEKGVGEFLVKSIRDKI